MTKIAGSGSECWSISQRHGSADPHQNVMDLQHCQQHHFLMKNGLPVGGGWRSMASSLSMHSMALVFLSPTLRGSLVRWERRDTPLDRISGHRIPFCKQSYIHPSSSSFLLCVLFGECGEGFFIIMIFSWMVMYYCAIVTRMSPFSVPSRESSRSLPWGTQACSPHGYTTPYLATPQPIYSIFAPHPNFRDAMKVNTFWSAIIMYGSFLRFSSINKRSFYYKIQVFD